MAVYDSLMSSVWQPEVRYKLSDSITTLVDSGTAPIAQSLSRNGNPALQDFKVRIPLSPEGLGTGCIPYSPRLRDSAGAFTDDFITPSAPLLNPAVLNTYTEGFISIYANVPRKWVDTLQYDIDQITDSSLCVLSGLDTADHMNLYVKDIDGRATDTTWQQSVILELNYIASGRTGKVLIRSPKDTVTFGVPLWIVVVKLGTSYQMYIDGLPVTTDVTLSGDASTTDWLHTLNDLYHVQLGAYENKSASVASTSTIRKSQAILGEATLGTYTPTDQEVADMYDAMINPVEPPLPTGTRNIWAGDEVSPNQGQSIAIGITGQTIIG